MLSIWVDTVITFSFLLREPRILFSAASLHATLSQINALVKDTVCLDLFTLLFTVLIHSGLKSPSFAFVTWLFIGLTTRINPLWCKAGVLWLQYTWGNAPKEDVCCGPCADEQPVNNAIPRLPGNQCKARFTAVDLDPRAVGFLISKLKASLNHPHKRYLNRMPKYGATP